MADTDNSTGVAAVPYARQLEQESIDAVSLVDELEKQRAERMSSGLFATEKGVVLKLKKFPARLVVDATSKLTEPKVPVVYIENKMRNEPNENDPQYVKDKQDYNNKLVSTLTRINLGFGTEVAAYPPGFEDSVPESEAWAADLTDLVGIEVPAIGTKSRYVAWLQYFVLTDVELNELNMAVLRYSTGIVVGDVVAAEASFPGVSEATADTPSQSEVPEVLPAHTDSGLAGNDARVRSEGSGEVRPPDVGPLF